MIDTSNSIASCVEQLKQCGDPRETRRWREGEPFYERTLGLGPDDVPTLLEIARSWLDDADWSDKPDDTTWYAPVHAWRALAKLRAPEAIGLLLEMLGPMDEQGDDWHLEEFPEAFALIGPPAFDPVADYLSDDSHAEYARICAADALRKLAQEHTDLREAAVRRFRRQLSKYEENPATLNAFVISYLVDLRAKEAAELIELAFAGGHVDEVVVGDWFEVSAELGVEGTGLVRARPRPSPGSHGMVGALAFGGGSSASGHGFKSRKAEKRKKQRAARKRGRRR